MQGSSQPDLYDRMVKYVHDEIGETMRMLLQFPEGLKQQALKYSKELESAGNAVYLSGSKSYGGCDVAFEEADAIGAEKIIHFGHSEFPIPQPIRDKYKHIAVEYREYFIDLDPKLIEKLAKYLKERKLNRPILASTVQHSNQMDKISDTLRKKSMLPILGKGIRTVYPGQVLGCDVSSVTSVKDKGDCVVYIGGGKFHYLALPPDLGLPIIAVNPYTNDVVDVTSEIKKYYKQRSGLIAKAAEGKTFGILVSTRAGQLNLDLAEEIKSRFEGKGKAAEIIVSREIDWEALQDFNMFDAYINTACPRLSEDWERAGKPIINVDELKLLFEMF